MKNILLALSVFLAFSAFAQQRYTDAVFMPETDGTLTPYGTNISILPIVLGTSTMPEALALNYRLYGPAGDTATNRPVVIIHHTGSYMPMPLNGGLTGTIDDAAVVEFANRFAARGYVVVTPEYRAGWNTVAPDVDEQTSTLLIASLRGAQDLNMMTRYLRKTVAEDGNPLGIDADRIMAVGLGTGGYNVNNANFLDNAAEVNALDKFIDTRNGLPYYDSTLYGNVYGTDQTQLNLPNHATYQSGFQFGVNLGGAMGDVTWIEGEDTEAPIVGLHSTQDANAPFGIGNILVPTTGNTVLQESPGTRVIVEESNMNGNNDILDSINQVLIAANDFLTTRVEALSTVDFTTRSGFETTLATRNMYPFVVDPMSQFANEYNYTDTSLLSAPVRGAISAFGLPFTFEQLVLGEQASNRNFLNPAGARLVMDTIMAYVLPRAYAALNLGDLVVSTTELSKVEAGLVVAPNPAKDFTVLRVNTDIKIEEVSVMNITGQVIARYDQVDASEFTLDLSNLPRGVQYLLIQTDKGMVADKIMID